MVEPLSSTELTSVVSEQFLDLSSFANKFICTQFLFFSLICDIATHAALMKSKEHHSSATESSESDIVSAHRFISTRDLMKWCARVDKLHKSGALATFGANEAIFCEAVDCFSGMITKPSLRKHITQLLGVAWDLPSDRIEFYLNMYKPSIQMSPTSITIGRVMLHKSEQVTVCGIITLQQIAVKSRSRFAHTTHSLRLLEKIAVCIKLDEPVLLVGETGTGKTSVIQYIADQMGETLLVLVCNSGQQHSLS